jgi:hypothetical protein
MRNSEIAYDWPPIRQQTMRPSLATREMALSGTAAQGPTHAECNDGGYAALYHIREEHTAERTPLVMPLRPYKLQLLSNSLDKSRNTHSSGSAASPNQNLKCTYFEHGHPIPKPNHPHRPSPPRCVGQSFAGDHGGCAGCVWSAGDAFLWAGGARAGGLESWAGCDGLRSAASTTRDESSGWWYVGWRTCYRE